MLATSLDWRFQFSRPVYPRDTTTDSDWFGFLGYEFTVRDAETFRPDPFTALRYATSNVLYRGDACEDIRDVMVDFAEHAIDSVSHLCDMPRIWRTYRDSVPVLRQREAWIFALDSVRYAAWCSGYSAGYRPDPDWCANTIRHADSDRVSDESREAWNSAFNASWHALEAEFNKRVYSVFSTPSN